jgi:hypothetical protein
VKEDKVRHPIRSTARAAAALLLLSTAPIVPATPARCCFRNPAYTGVCEVQPAKDESCAQILEYLNNRMSQGKSYCHNTDVRGGWTETSCETKAPRAAGSH